MTVLLTVGLVLGTAWCAAMVRHEHRHPRCRCLHPFRRHHARPVNPVRHARLWIVERDQ